MKCGGHLRHRGVIFAIEDEDVEDVEEDDDTAPPSTCIKT